MEKYNHKDIEKKWQERWSKENIFDIDKDKKTEKGNYYILDMFPYPSGDGFHMGHTESYTASDIFYRYKKMSGFNVLHPQGFDSFGLPAENYAIKTGIHPRISTQNNEKNFSRQWTDLGLGHDLKNVISTSSPQYYKWTQFLFGKFFENQIVERKTDKINWCPSCNTGIANEQVESGKCERCKTDVEQKEIPGWFFKITDFADDLIWDEKNSNIDWPESTKKNQNAWIGKSEGSKIKFPIKFNSQYLKDEIEVFTTRADTIFGATYMVLAPEHDSVQKFLKEDLIKNPKEVREYIENTNKKTELNRLNEWKERTGVRLEGVMAVNPAREKSGMDKNVEIPIFISDYVLAGYGTGAIMAVPAHDERDYEFAKKFDIPIIFVNDFRHWIVSAGNGLTEEETDISEFSLVKELKNKGYFYIKNYDEKKIQSMVGSASVFMKEYKLINSGEFNGGDSQKAKKKITEFVGGEMTSTYRLRDWSISRQRYWGCPIPIVYSPEGEAKFVGEENLPWTLPEDVDFIPDGTSPLAKSKELKKRTEKIFGKGWTPEVDTMDTFVDSSWYFLRYPDTNNEKEFCSKQRLESWMPNGVDLYIGGAEHTYMHLLYARFFTKALKKIGLVDFDEPFLKLRHQGMVNDKTGKKMSKSKGNVVNPDEMLERFGADAVRTYMMFSSPLEDDVIWNEDNIVGVYRFLEKVWNLKEKISDKKNLEVKKELHKTIKKVGEQVNDMKYNTAISDMMKFINFATKQGEIGKDDYKIFLKILSPFAPHICDELTEEILLQKQWPEFDEGLTKTDEIVLGVQVNGKRRGEIKISPEADQDTAESFAKQNPEVAKWLEGDIKKVIYVSERILNFIV